MSPKELAYYNFNDKRLLQRFELVMTKLLSGASKSFPDLFGSKAELKGFYRFIENAEVTETGLLSAHSNYTIEELNHNRQLDEWGQLKESVEGKLKYGFVLHDSMSMSTSGYQKKAVGYLRDANSKGIWLHHSLLLDEHFKVMGLLDSHYIVREEYGKKHDRKHKPIAEKESYKWIRGIQKAAAIRQATIVHVADRESDVMAFLEAVLKQEQHFVVRSAQDRKLWADSVRLFEKVKAAPGVCVQRQLRDKNGKCYQAECVLHYQSVELTKKDTPLRLPLQVVYLKQKHGEVEWLLLTSLPVESQQEALFILDIYQQRWLIEEYHKCLKTGCLLEQRQVNEADNLFNMIALLQITALKLLQLKHLSFEPTPEQTAVLAILAPRYLTKVEQIELLEGSALWRLVLMARLGGHQGLKHKGMPGWQTLWKGWQFFQVFLQGFAAAQAIRAPQQQPDNPTHIIVGKP
jgi:hypothetical protein